MKNSHLHNFWVYPEKHSPPVGRARIFRWKKLFAIFWPKLKFQTLVFSFFRTSETCFSNLTSIILKNLYLRILLLHPEFFFISYGATTHFLFFFYMFLPISGFQASVFHFFRFSELFFCSDFDQLEKLYFLHLLVLPRKKKLPLMAWARLF